ncbi:MAG: N-formylglutamate amidohydrolase [Rhodospirillales bacterium]|nr:N-formylglutamate amidohydrolase [Rhodospirillales bacterium]
MPNDRDDALTSRLEEVPGVAESVASITTLIGPADPPPFRVVNPGGSAPLLIVCDHASNLIPPVLNGLGVSDHDLRRHIGYDIGAADLTEKLARRLDAPAVLAGYSRLLIDCNRQPGDPQSILDVSDGTLIPGNVGLDEAERVARTETFHWPYHHGIETVLAHLRRRGPEPVFFSVHTFTPSLGGRDRFWDIGVLWNRDPRIAVPLVDLLRQHGDLKVGDNEPYSGKDIAYTVNLHAGAVGLPNAAVEVRQDHCETPDACERWAKILGDAMEQILAMDHLHALGEF